MFNSQQHRIFASLFVIMLSMIACSPRANDPLPPPIQTKPIIVDRGVNQAPPPQPRPVVTKPQPTPPTPRSTQHVKGFEVLLFQGYPGQAHTAQASVAIDLELRQSCENVAGVRENFRREIDTFTLQIDVEKRAGQACVTQPRRIEQIVPLDLNGLQAGIYFVEIAGEQQAFELLMDTVQAF